MKFISAIIKKRESVLKILLPVTACLLVLMCIFLVWICKFRGRISECNISVALLRTTNKQYYNSSYPPFAPLPACLWPVQPSGQLQQPTPLLPLRSPCCSIRLRRVQSCHGEMGRLARLLQQDAASSLGVRPGRISGYLHLHDPIIWQCKLWANPRTNLGIYNEMCS